MEINMRKYVEKFYVKLSNITDTIVFQEDEQLTIFNPATKEFTRTEIAFTRESHKAGETAEETRNRLQRNSLHMAELVKQFNEVDK
jgi:hypothetical protein